ncbi:MAG: SOS response-associated peptidase [Actinomycetota bacterium]
MCGRFVAASPPDELARYFETEPPTEELEANYNVAPTNTVYAVRARDGHRQLSELRWGLVPFWAKDRKVGSRMINARSETILDKPAYRRAIQKRRCLIPADGFYEWAKVPGHKKKQPYFIHHRDDEPLVFAGLWERWSPPEGSDDELGPDGILETCTILTCAPNATMASIHDRMPVLLAPAVWDEWLTHTDDVADLTRLLVPAPDEILDLRAVTPAVNNVRNRGAHLLDPDPEPLVAEGE